MPEVHTTDEHISATLDFVGPLAPNLQFADVLAQVVAWSISDGVSITSSVTSADCSFTVNLTTDSSGILTAWSMREFVIIGGRAVTLLVDTTGDQSIAAFPVGSPNCPGLTTNCTDTALTAADSPGSWTSPANPTIPRQVDLRYRSRHR